MSSINLLFSIDDGYLDQLKVMLYSISLQMPKQQVAVYVLQKNLLKKTVELQTFLEKLGMTYHPVIIGENAFPHAPTTERYPDTIYYRLLAHEYLPEDIERILYLDADMLCLNSFDELYQLDMGDNLYAAASHNTDQGLMDQVNKVRLQNFQAESYFNSGLLLLNLPKIRQAVKRDDILKYIEHNRQLLVLPDQDVLNGLYGHRILQIPDQIYNFDARYSWLYLVRSHNLWDLDWVINHTVFLHFCGREKPWRADYHGRFSGLYKFLQKEALKL